MRIRASKIRYRGTRAEQQDQVSMFSIPGSGGDEDYMVAVLTDGIGGLPKGSEASTVVNEGVCETLKRDLEVCRPHGRAIRDTLERAAHTANDTVRLFRQNAGISQCGSTLVACVLQSGWLHYLSIGDSMLFLYAARTGLKRINDRHTKHVDGKDYLASAVTGDRLRSIDLGSLNVASDGYLGLLVSSDGLSSLSAEAVWGILTTCGDRKLNRIVDLAQTRKCQSQDNLSMILMEFAPGMA